MYVLLESFSNYTVIVHCIIGNGTSIQGQNKMQGLLKTVVLGTNIPSSHHVSSLWFSFLLAPSEDGSVRVQKNGSLMYVEVVWSSWRSHGNTTSAFFLGENVDFFFKIDSKKLVSAKRVKLRGHNRLFKTLMAKITQLWNLKDKKYN